MQSYHLTDEFTDIAAEQAVLASIKQSPALYWDFVDFLTLEVFTKEASTWQALTLALSTRTYFFTYLCSGIPSNGNGSPLLETYKNFCLGT